MVTSMESQQRERPVQRRRWLFLPCLILLANCRTVFPEWSNDQPRKVMTPQEEQAAFDKCLSTIPMLHEEPWRAHHVVRTLTVDSEGDLAWYACIDKADAVILDGPCADASATKDQQTEKAGKKCAGRSIAYDEPPPREVYVEEGDRH